MPLRDHWSLVVIDMVEKIVLYCNSMARTTHVEIKNRVNILLDTIENFHNSKVFKEMKHKNVQIPKQDLGHTCGWYVLYSACAILDKVYNEGKSKMPMDMYSTLDLLLFRIGVVEDILDHMTLTVPKAVEEDETKYDIVMMDRSDLTKKAEDEEEGKQPPAVPDSSTGAFLSPSADTGVTLATCLPIVDSELASPPSPQNENLKTEAAGTSPAKPNVLVSPSCPAEAILSVSLSPQLTPPGLPGDSLENLDLQ